MTSDEYLVRDLVGLNCLANNEEGEVVSVAVVNVVPPDGCMLGSDISCTPN